MRRTCLAVLVSVAWVLSTRTVLSFCGFYVAKADSKLFNKASRVAIAREGDETVLTMANDFQGEPRDFAVVIPVPTFIERKAIQVLDMALLDHLDAYSAPRLVEYFDQDPCRPPVMTMAAGGPQSLDSSRAKAEKRGVTIEAQYTVGEYDILILSAEQSSGLETWLRENGYKIPAGATGVLGSYIKQGMHFFVARVNLKEQAKLGFTFLRPLQVTYVSPKFMLPIRLGTVNASGPQELFIYTLTPKGRVETTNYRTVRLPSGMDLPLFVKDEFKDFYKAMFGRAVEKEDMKAVFLEYAWDTGWCDPCVADPLSPAELAKLGVSNRPSPDPSRPFARGQGVFLTRLHVRYDAAHFPEDLVFQETGDRENFQGRYVLRHPWVGEPDCERSREYRQGLVDRQEKEAQALASLTGWDITAIRAKMKPVRISENPRERPWYRRLF
jgi:hypothetical protein